MTVPVFALREFLYSLPLRDPWPERPLCAVSRSSAVLLAIAPIRAHLRMVRCAAQFVPRERCVLQYCCAEASPQAIEACASSSGNIVPPPRRPRDDEPLENRATKRGLPVNSSADAQAPETNGRAASLSPASFTAIGATTATSAARDWRAASGRGALGEQAWQPAAMAQAAIRCDVGRKLAADPRPGSASSSTADDGRP